ncbi:MAG: glycosyltransferase family 2 protein [Flavobacteriales bacterium]|nr:glycosyltransferase family 2 protein [Flavobacteriales bacterium]MCB9193246.1 glycosyltransferase family 2 protein [Flavobacteriales bacterium]
MDISAVVITRNEAHNIGRCLEAAARVAKELIVVDAESTDDTRAIAEAHGARVTLRPWTNYSDQKNFANGLAQGPYILSLDADEVLSDALTADILRQRTNGLHGAYRLKRLTNYCGQWVRHGGWYPDAKVRLFPKQEARWAGDHVHESLVLPPGTVITDLNGDLLHFSYRSLDDHRDRIDRYSDLHARAMFEKGRKGGIIKHLFAPWVKFIQGYVLQAGFLDGWAGWSIAVMSARAVRLKYEKLDALYRGANA